MTSLHLENFKQFSNIDIDINSKNLTLIAGVNNAGKTSILHSLAVWEYAKILLINYRGKESLTKRYKSDKGLGIPPESFSPINIPSLRYLWKDQKTNGSYNLKIKITWLDSEKNELFLGIAFTLNGNNFAIKKYESNLLKKDIDIIPTIAYLPPFGGMNDKESLLSIADRRNLIGKGQAGSVIRNLLLDLHRNHEKLILKKRNEIFPGKKRLTSENKEILAQINTEWRQLKKIIADVFKVQLKVHHFDSEFHNHINIDLLSLVNIDDKICPDNTTKRDLMVEGSGFLQWISVFALALDSNNDILLLDEPDAHLHSSLQILLLEKLETICIANNKQILLVSHSSDLIKLINHKQILQVQKANTSYLASDDRKVILLEGLGSQYFPLMEKIKRDKNIILVENQSDERVLKHLAKSLDIPWPKNLVLWSTNKSHKERKTLIIELNQKIMVQTGKPIKAYSLRDLDDQSHNVTNDKLNYNGWNDQKDDSGQHTILRYRTLRRREIENYLIIPSAISRYITTNCKNSEISKDEKSVNDYLRDEHGLIVPDIYKTSKMENKTEGLFLKDPKPVLDGINSHFKVKFDKEAYIESILSNEICDDLKLIINELVSMCEN